MLIRFIFGWYYKCHIKSRSEQSWQLCREHSLIIIIENMYVDQTEAKYRSFPSRNILNKALRWTTVRHVYEWVFC